jgi:hypothetical protein
MNLPFFQPAPKKKYITIESLVAEISRLLRSGDFLGLKALIDYGNSFSEHYFAIMQDVEKRYKYVKLLDEEIKKHGTPTSGFELGGCSVELGHIHIQFELKEGWHLKKIWMCR